MIVFLAGSVFGQIHQFYDRVLALEKDIDAKAEWVLSTGNFGIYPDPHRISKATREHTGAGDFARMYIEGTPAPRPTILVAGAHDDHMWLDQRAARGHLDLLPGLTYLVNGNHTTIGDMKEQLVVCGLGKVYSPRTYSSFSGAVTPPKHYTRREVAKCKEAKIDLLLTHEAPYKARFGSILSVAKGIDDVIHKQNPKLVAHGNVNRSLEYLYHFGPTQAISLANHEIVAYEYRVGTFLRLS